MIEYYKNLSLENLFYIDENGLVKEEEWRDIPNYIGRYKGSNLGRLKTVARFFINHLNLKINIKEKILIQNTAKRYLSVSLCDGKNSKTWSVHQLMYLTFYGYYPKRGSGFKIDHDDNISTNNILTNLNVITDRKNLTKDKNLNGKLLGTSKEKGKFRSSIQLNGCRFNLGTYKTEKEAGDVYKEAFILLETNKSIEHLIKPRDTSSTGEPYIYLEKNHYSVRIKINKKNKRFGRYKTLEEAVIKRDEMLKGASNNG